MTSKASVLRTAFMVVEYVEKLRLDLAPLEGSRAAEIVDQISSTSPQFAEMTRKLVE